MPDWQQLLLEFQAETEKGHPDAFDIVRRRYLAQLVDYAGRNVIAYYSAFLSKPGVQLLGLNDEDMNGFMMAVHGLDRTRGLELFLHTPVRASRPPVSSDSTGMGWRAWS